MKLIFTDKTQTGIRRYAPTFSRIAGKFKEKIEKQPDNRDMVEIRTEKREKLIETKGKEFDVERQMFRVWDIALKVSASMLFLEVIVGIEEAFRNPFTINKLIQHELGDPVLFAPPLLPVIYAIGFEIVSRVRQLYLAVKIAGLEEELGID
ncbi:hypothetical protein J4450_02515 [Candidatus Micrarchaeota archaeon]|nr:hypothetical protein [Candidatus Micrarchaeota archaeon]